MCSPVGASQVHIMTNARDKERHKRLFSVANEKVKFRSSNVGENVVEQNSP